MLKHVTAVVVALIIAFSLTINVKAAEQKQHFTKDDTWLIYWYICEADNLEGGWHLATKDIAEMNTLIATQIWDFLPKIQSPLCPMPPLNYSKRLIKPLSTINVARTLRAKVFQLTVLTFHEKKCSRK